MFKYPSIYVLALLGGDYQELNERSNLPKALHSTNLTDKKDNERYLRPHFPLDAQGGSPFSSIHFRPDS